MSPVQGDFPEAPPIPRDVKSVSLAPEDCRRLLDVPPESTPAGIRDRAQLAIRAYTAAESANWRGRP